jgi:Flp pilus assembly protein TadG
MAMSAVVLIGAASLAVDLSLQTHDQRNLQNASDAAALSGAEDLPASVTANDQYHGAQDALQMIRKKLGWQNIVAGGGTVTNSQWAAALAGSCSSANNQTSPPGCDVTKTVCTNAVPAPSDLPATCDSYAALGSNAHYFTITVQTPPKLSSVVTASTPDPLHFFEVVVRQDTQNYLAGVMGTGISTQGARSTAYHFPPDQSFGFALYAQSIVQTQNKSTLVVGDVYANRNVDPQSSGIAGFCAAGGLVILGSPQWEGGTSSDPADGQHQVLPNTADVIQYDPTNCALPATNNITSGYVAQSRDPSLGCTVSGSSFPASYDSAIGACVADPPLQSPFEPSPDMTSTATYTCATNVASAGTYTYSTSSAACSSNPSNETLVINNSSTAQLGAGVYKINHNSNCSPKSCYDVDITANVTLPGVTFWLQPGATIGVHGNGTTVSIDPSPAAPPILSANQPPSNSDGRMPIYAPGSAQVWVTDSGANLTLYGTMYMPNGLAHTDSNAWYSIDGQAIVGTWDDQGGNHPSPDITYDGSRNVPQPEVLKLVE